LSTSGRPAARASAEGLAVEAGHHDQRIQQGVFGVAVSAGCQCCGPPRQRGAGREGRRLRCRSSGQITPLGLRRSSPRAGGPGAPGRACAGHRAGGR
jgi:hypothetical protein